MLYVILGIVLVAVISSFVRRKAIEAPVEPLGQNEGELSPAPQIEEKIIEEKIAEPIQNLEKILSSIDVPEPEKDISPLPDNVAPPITSPSVSASAMYSDAGVILHAQKSIKKDAYGLHWCNKSSELNMIDFVMKGPMVYWSDGAPGVPEPSCIDTALPFELPSTDNTVHDGAESYAAMTPLMRGAYLLWIAGGRNLMPTHVSQPTIWFMGIERRVLVDRQDVAMCAFETFRLLPIIRSEAIRRLMEKFAVWVCVRTVMSEEQIIRLILPLADVPPELFCFMLSNYSAAKLPMPSHLAYVLMRSSPLAGREAVPYSENLVNAFAAIYKNRTNGGLTLATPRTKISIVYAAANESIPKEKRAQEIIEIPDFFKDISQFAPLIDAWSEFNSRRGSGEFDAPPENSPDIPPLDERKDWGIFIRDKLGDAEPPLITSLGEIAEFVGLDTEEKPAMGARKQISETARVEGFLLIPDICVPGKNYSWDDRVGLSPVAMGERISDSYNAAALSLEFAAALAGGTGSVSSLLEMITARFSLTNDELTRLNVLAKILEQEAPEPDNIGECIEVWFQPEERAFIRDFFYNLLGDAELAEPLATAGEKLTEIFGTLFRNR